MARPPAFTAPAGSSVGEADLVARIRRHDPAAFEALMRRHNGTLFRVARAILKDDADAEDALQDGYLEAYRRIGDFRGESQLSTWLTRIVINQALMRYRRQKRDRVVVPFGTRREPDRECVAADVADDKAESPPDARMHTVSIDGTSFQPARLTVSAGDTVVWINKDPFPHTATSTSGAFDSGSIAPDKSWRFATAKKGDFDYVCTLHPTMKARLTVE